MKKENLLTLSALVILAAATRLVNHPDNFTPIAAIALFSGSFLSQKRLALLIPVLALFISDVIIGVYPTIWVVYLCFAATTYIGFRIKDNVKVSSVAGASLLSSVIFYLVTNFAEFILYYERSVSGLISCYTLAVPFFRNSLMGDLFYSGLLFGSFYLIRNSFLSKVSLKKIGQ